jgi:5-methylcytosine-specific restriction protein A
VSSREDFNLDEIKIAYDVARRVSRKEMTEKEAKAYLFTTIRAAEYTASSYIQAYKHMRLGTTYESALGMLAFENFAKSIGEEFGSEARALALQSVIRNIEFYEHWKSQSVGKPVTRKKHRRLHAQLVAETSVEPVHPDEVPQDQIPLVEGAVRTVSINQYERNRKARELAIAYYKCRCYVCEFDFEKQYGAIGRDFIHVHHVIDIASIGEAYQIDPIKDLRPVCPNCHAMLHTSRPAMDIDKLRALVKDKHEAQ